MMLLFLLTFCLKGMQIILPCHGQDVPIQVNVNLDSSIFTVEKEFLSITMNIGMMGSPTRWKDFNPDSSRVQTLLRGLSPGYFRLGGGSADHVVYTNVPPGIFKELTKGNPLLTINDMDIDILVKLVRKTGYKLLYDLNLQLRYGSQWNPTNAAELLAYIRKKGYQDVFNFQLGNEPDSFHNEGPDTVVLNGTQIGKDYKVLKQLLQDYNFTDCVLTGPESAHLGPTSFKLFTDFITEAGGNLTAASIHHYYFDGPSATLASYLNSSYFKGYEHKILHGKAIIKARSPRSNLPLWMTEGADAQSSGSPNLSNRYVGGLFWMETLGISAKLGVGVTARQSFYCGRGGYYCLTGEDSKTHPDYWLMYVHKQLVGQKVFNVTTSQSGGACMAKHTDVRVYAHCTKPSSKYPAGAVTVFALNVNTQHRAMLKFPDKLANQIVDIYHLTPVGPDGLVSDVVALNNKTLELIDDWTLPELHPVTRSAQDGIALPQTTYMFMVFPHAKIKECMT